MYKTIRMPPKQRQNVNRHGTQEGQQTKVEHYKTLTNYKNLTLINDDISTKIRQLYNNNIWNLQDKFKDLEEHYEDLGIKGLISWNNKIQYLDYQQSPKPLNNISLKSLKEGEYKSKYTDKKPNSIKTEAGYANRISFFTRTFKSLEQYKNQDGLSWIIPNNRLLMYEIMKYHNDNNRTVSTLNNDFKTLVRVIKLLLGEEDELRFKYSALQIAFSDIENAKDDNNKIITEQEIRQFIPYEQLLQICDELEEDYNQELNKLPLSIRKDGLKHSNKLFNQHQILLAVALNVWDYPSRHEKFSLSILEDEKEVSPNKNFIVIPTSNKVCKFVLNEVVKEHKPLSYNIDSKAISGLNKRLNTLLKYSYKTYKRPHMFIGKDKWNSQKLEKVSPSTVSDWLREVLETKNIGIDGFRSAFVSYYYPKFNNRQKAIMKTRMRTSRDILERSYLKHYTSPDELIKVKIEPNIELIANTSAGTTKETGIIVYDNNKQNKSKEEKRILPINEEKTIDTKDTHTRKQKNFQKWYEKKENKEKHLDKVRQHSKKISVYQSRILRELNNGKMDFKRLQPTTIDKYGIKVKDGIYYTDKEIKD